MRALSRPRLMTPGTRLALTGGIACGKSLVSETLETWGWKIIDTDGIARECLKPDSEGYKKTVDVFGPDILCSDRTVDRARLGRIVFSDVEKLNLLNSILHPLIRDQWQRQLDHHLRITPEVPAVVVIPLLFETSIEGRFDRVICIGSSEVTQAKRLETRGLEKDEIRKRMASQLAVKEKMKRSDIVVWNDGSKLLLKQQVRRLHENLCGSWMRSESN
jgi:dephospho-CoA kinase